MIYGKCNTNTWISLVNLNFQVNTHLFRQLGNYMVNSNRNREKKNVYTNQLNRSCFVVCSTQIKMFLNGWMQKVRSVFQHRLWFRCFKLFPFLFCDRKCSHFQFYWAWPYIELDTKQHCMLPKLKAKFQKCMDRGRWESIMQLQCTLIK